MKKAVLILINLLVVSGCQTVTKDENKYVLAVNTNGGIQRTKHVSVAIPGQLMPLRTNGPAKKLIGEEATNAANQKSLKRATSGEYINSIVTFDYIEGTLYQIYTAPLSITDIQFQENEHIVAVGAGDTTRWKVTKTYSGIGVNRREHLLIKPVEEDLVNGMVITTDLRTYHLILNSTPKTYMASATWRYPDENGLITTFGDDEAYEADSTLGVDINNISFSYKIKLAKGKIPNWYPKMVFHDGKKTYIKFSSQAQDAPSLFIVEDKTPQIVNYRVQGDYYIIDKVIYQAQLHSGTGPKATVVQIIMK